MVTTATTRAVKIEAVVDRPLAGAPEAAALALRYASRTHRSRRGQRGVQPMVPAVEERHGQIHVVYEQLQAEELQEVRALEAAE